MKAFDHDKPANKSEWIFAFLRVYQELRPDIGEKYAGVHAQQAYLSLKGLAPADAARRWHKQHAA